MALRSFVALLLSWLVLVAPRTCFACWDGWNAEVGQVAIRQAGDDTFRLETARDVARWGARIDALLPRSANVDVEHGFVSVGVTGKFAEGRWSGASLADLFANVARLVHASPSTIAAARALDHDAFTVQLFAGGDRERARVFARSIDDDVARRGLALPVSFYSAGGYPAVHPSARVVEADVGGAHVYRVVVGAFLARSAASEAARLLGRPAFVRAI